MKEEEQITHDVYSEYGKMYCRRGTLKRCMQNLEKDFQTPSEGSAGSGDDELRRRANYAEVVAVATFCSEMRAGTGISRSLDGSRGVSITPGSGFSLGSGGVVKSSTSDINITGCSGN